MHRCMKIWQEHSSHVLGLSAFSSDGVRQQVETTGTSVCSPSVSVGWWEVREAPQGCQWSLAPSVMWTDAWPAPPPFASLVFQAVASTLTTAVCGVFSGEPGCLPLERRRLPSLEDAWRRWPHRRWVGTVCDSGVFRSVY